MTRHRTRDPQPLDRSGEIAILALAGALSILALAALTGLAAASAVFGGGWVWPADTEHLITATVGLLTGHPGHGLAPADAARVPEATLVYGTVAVTEALTLTAAGAVGVVLARFLAGGDTRRGMATRVEAARVLGVRRLRRARTIIRPDLSGPHPACAPSGRRGFDPAQVGWQLGRSRIPWGVDLWVRYDRTTGVYGAQGSGKTLDLLAPALLAHPGAALVTLTKLDDLLLTVGRRRTADRPIVVLDPFGAAPGLPELVWDPIAGCVDPQTAERRAKAFAAGTVTGAVSAGRADNAARFYAAETAKVLQGFFHAAALTGRTLDDVLEWVANPVAAEQPAEILARHPQAARFWDGLLSGALHGSADTVGNTVTTVQQALALFFQPAIRARCIPAPGRAATDLAALLAAHGTIYLLGREDPYASASPLLTAVAEHVLDTALAMANTSPYGRATPSFLACLDELPSTTPLPTLRVRMANERALGLSFLYAAQTWRQMVVCYGEDEARSLFGLTNTIVVFGGGKDIAFYREVSELIGSTRVSRQTVSDGPGGVSTSRAAEDTPILRPEHLRLLPDRQALVVAENAPPVIAHLRRCIDGTTGRALLADQAAARDQVAAARRHLPDLTARTTAAVAYSRAHHLHSTTSPDRE
jgi:hypothetical protein